MHFMEARLFATESPRFLAYRVRSRVGSQRPPKILNLFLAIAAERPPDSAPAGRRLDCGQI